MFLCQHERVFRNILNNIQLRFGLDERVFVRTYLFLIAPFTNVMSQTGPFFPLYKTTQYKWFLMVKNNHVHHTSYHVFFIEHRLSLHFQGYHDHDQYSKLTNVLTLYIRSFTRFKINYNKINKTVLTPTTKLKKISYPYVYALLNRSYKKLGYNQTISFYSNVQNLINSCITSY